MSACRPSSVGMCTESARLNGIGTSARRATAAGCPTVDTVMRRAPICSPSGWFMTSMAASTAAMLCVGSPEPMKT